MANKLKIYQKIKTELLRLQNQPHYLNMEEKRNLILNGEQVPICVNSKKSKPMNRGTVKYYSKYLNKKMKI